MSGWSWRTRAAVCVFVLLLGGFMARILIAPESTGVTVAFPDSPGEAAAVREAPGGGTYAYMVTQPDSDDPVTYDPCRPVRLVVNDRAAPPGAADALERALDDLESRTGLDFVVEGTTDETPDPDWEPQEEGDGWAPVLLAWSDPEEYDELAGDVLGFAGSAWVPQDGYRWYVTGQVVLDGPQLGDLGRTETTTTILHEFGHLLGLDHVDDRGELMHPTTTGRTDWGPGDLAGLAALGQGRCA